MDQKWKYGVNNTNKPVKDVLDKYKNVILFHNLSHYLLIRLTNIGE
jgi:hypothetical protein